MGYSNKAIEDSMRTSAAAPQGVLGSCMPNHSHIYKAYQEHIDQNIKKLVNC